MIAGAFSSNPLSRESGAELIYWLFLGTLAVATA